MILRHIEFFFKKILKWKDVSTLTIWDDYETEIIFGHTVCLKRDIIINFENEFDFFLSAKFLIDHSSTINPCEHNVLV